jgi:hypothetical protein
MDEHTKAEYFRLYIKRCRLVEFHSERKDTLFAEKNRGWARRLAADFPDFPDAFRTKFPEKAHLAIDESENLS